MRPGKSERTDDLTMTTTELSAFRKTLENRQTELGNENRSREALAIETSPDELDRIQHASERDHAISNLERNSDRLREVQAALHRMHASAFGTCVCCEGNISIKRLAAVPWASYCIVCQVAADRGQETSRLDMEPSLDVAA
jgi:DnaK suppressor protein